MHENSINIGDSSFSLLSTASTFSSVWVQFPPQTDTKDTKGSVHFFRCWFGGNPPTALHKKVGFGPKSNGTDGKSTIQKWLGAYLRSNIAFAFSALDWQSIAASRAR
jgi:hypothetical protein